MAKQKQLIKNEEIAFRWDDQSGEYKAFEIGTDANDGVYIFTRKGIKGDEETKENISFYLNDAEFMKLKMAVDKIWEKRKARLFQ